MNHVELTACIAEAKPLRYSPAGIPMLDLVLEHESTIEQAGQARQVRAVVKAHAQGAMAEKLQSQPMGSRWQFAGFLATPRMGKSVVFHIQQFQPD